LKRGILILTLVISSLAILPSARVSGHDVTLDGWKTNHQEAWRSAQIEHRPMLLYISSDNCVYCKKMVHDTLSDKSVAARIQGEFVPVNVAAEDNRLLVRKLRVKSYPTTVIISPRSVVLDYISGYVSADELKLRLTTAVDRLADNRR
jgi:protein disulfide-isomerase